MKEEALDRAVWKTRDGRRRGPIVRQASCVNFDSNKLFELVDLRQRWLEGGIQQWAEGGKSRSSVMTTILGSSVCSHGIVSIRPTQRSVSLVPRF